MTIKPWGSPQNAEEEEQLLFPVPGYQDTSPQPQIPRVPSRNPKLHQPRAAPEAVEGTFSWPCILIPTIFVEMELPCPLRTRSLPHPTPCLRIFIPNVIFSPYFPASLESWGNVEVLSGPDFAAEAKSWLPLTSVTTLLWT